MILGLFVCFTLTDKAKFILCLHSDLFVYFWSIPEGLIVFQVETKVNISRPNLHSLSQEICNSHFRTITVCFFVTFAGEGGVPIVECSTDSTEKLQAGKLKQCHSAIPSCQATSDRYPLPKPNTILLLVRLTQHVSNALF